MLYKRMDMQSTGFRDIPPHQAADFFRKAGQIQTQHGKLDWGMVRGLLQDKLVEQETHQTITKVRGKFLPLSVYEKKGFDTKVIEETAEKQKSDMFGWVYRVPILEVSYSKIEEEAAKKAGKEDETEEKEADEEIDVKEWQSIDSSSDDEGCKHKGKPRGGAKAKAASKKSKVSKEQQAEAKKANNEILGAARKGLRLLEPVLKEAKKACKSANCTQDLKDESDAIASVVKECKSITQKHQQASKDGVTLKALSLQMPQIKELAKAVKAKAEATNNFASCLSALGDDGLIQLAEAAKRRSQASDVE
eukprot:s1265_g9.t1